MVNEEILGGLKSALERGEPLNKAMMSLYNSGYEKKEIEECAKRLVEARRAPQEELANQFIQPIPEAPAEPQTPQQKKQPVQQPAKPVQQARPVQPQQQVQEKRQPVQKEKPADVSPEKEKPYRVTMPVQRISGYGTEITSREKAVIIILVFLLIFLVAVLGLIFFFKEEIINFFSNFFG